MFHLRKLISPSTTPLANPLLFHIPSLYRRPAAPVSEDPFVVEDYLVTTCGLTRAQALKASRGLSHLRSPSNSDAVLAFLSGLGLSSTDIAAVVSTDPNLLCADVEKNLAKRVTELTDLGLSRPQICRLIPLARISFRASSLAGNLGFWLSVFGSLEVILKYLKRNSGLLATDLEKVAKPNLALLQQCGIHVGDYNCAFISQLLTRPPKLLQDAAARASECGLPKGSQMFGYALTAFAGHNEEKLAKKIGILESFGWSHEDLLTALRKAPLLFNMSEERLRRNLDFLTMDVGLKVRYIAQRPVMVMYSLERRLLPRHCLLKVLDAEGLVDAELSFFTAVMATEKQFIERFVLRYEDIVPTLASTYASSCATGAGKVPKWCTLRDDKRELENSAHASAGSFAMVLFYSAVLDGRF